MFSSRFVAMVRFPKISITEMVRRLAAGAWSILRPGNASALALLPVLALPFAMAAGWVSETLSSAPQSVIKPIAIPELELRQPAETVDAFAERLQQVFGLPEARSQVFADWILEASTRHDLEPSVLASLIYTESSFRKQVTSWAGAIGPAQVKPKYWTEFCGGTELDDPEHNVYCGAQVLAHFRERCGDLECALRLYNVGPGNMRLPQYQKASSRYLVRIRSNRSMFEETTML